MTDAAALAADVAGGGYLVDVAMAGVCADFARQVGEAVWPHTIARAGQGWKAWHGELWEPVRSP